MNRSDNIGELAGALALAQGKFKSIIKSETVDFTNLAGKRTHYNYAPLNAVIDSTKDSLAAEGLSVIQATRVDEGKLFVENWLCHKSGQWVQSDMYVCETSQTPQAIGSALTYARRYGYSALLCVSSEEDDDAQEAQKQHGAKPRPQDAPTAPKPEPVKESVPPKTEVKAALEHLENAPPNAVTQEQLKTIAALRNAKWNYSAACVQAGYGQMYVTKLTTEQADYLVSQAAKEGYTL